MLCSVKHAQGRREGQEPVQAETGTPETKGHIRHVSRNVVRYSVELKRERQELTMNVLSI